MNRMIVGHQQIHHDGKAAQNATATITTTVEPINSSQVGQVHFFSSSMVSRQ